MCNRYSQKGSLEQVRRMVKQLKRDLVTTPATDNLREYDVYPDQDAPVLRPTGNGALELALLRWGFPGIEQRGKDGKPKKPTPITNIRNLNSPWWKDVNREYLLEPQYRCLVPFTAFAEPPFKPTWFAVPDVELAFFAGIWRPWHGERLKVVERKSRRVRIEDDFELFAFLTTEANDIVRPVHDKAMPVILHDTEECNEWLSGGSLSLRLQRPLPNDELQVAGVN